MIVLNTVQETTERDINLHYADCLMYDEEEKQYFIMHRYEGGKAHILYRTEEGTEHKVLSVRKAEFRKKFKGVSLPDGYVNYKGCAALITRKYDGSYRKCTSISRMRVDIPCLGFLERSRINMPRVDPITALNNLDVNGYPSRDVAIAKLRGSKAASIAISPEFCVAKNSGREPWHVMYYSTHVGYMFKTGEVVLIPQEIQELAQERGLI